ncbi:MAG: hydroxyectoine utilization dehydratase EutB [Hyphomicrobiales bacterium]|nr:hydroxyectoine utilization dehydratase EutB [Hyphomicrobiales bacterium]MCY4048337.1 hydroxyectoine utilization dehydratase EutB [Hyphomicrobiales bacterium]MCY4053886.1 hydroxyectoine utilization dehydratase EutB [Hyphomicrobiales bacterium]
MSLNLQDIRAAHKRIRHISVTTPLIPSMLSGQAGYELLLKLETTQPTRSFKIRGATNAIESLTDEQKSRGIVCCSTGNHGRAIAFAAKQMGITATVCLSELVPAAKVKAIEDLGANVRRVGQTQEDAILETNRIASGGVTEISAFDDAGVIAGQATIALELFERRFDLQNIIIPLSGGGLAGGIAFAAKQIQPRVHVVGVSMERGAGMYEAIRAGKPVEVEEYPSLADALGGGIGANNQITFKLCRKYLDDIILVSETDIYKAMRIAFQQDCIITEGAGAVCHAALLAGKLKLEGATAFVVSGANVDMEMFQKIINGETLRLGDVEIGT